MKRKQLKAFTMIEMFIVLTIISILTLMVITNIKDGKHIAQEKTDTIGSYVSDAKNELDAIQFESNK